MEFIRLKSEGNELLRKVLNQDPQERNTALDAFAIASTASEKYHSGLKLPNLPPHCKAQLYKNLSQASEVQEKNSENKEIALFYFDRSLEYVDQALYLG